MICFIYQVKWPKLFLVSDSQMWQFAGLCVIENGILWSSKSLTRKTCFLLLYHILLQGFPALHTLKMQSFYRKVQNQFKNWLYIAELVHLPISAFPSWTLIQIFLLLAEAGSLLNQVATLRLFPQYTSVRIHFRLCLYPRIVHHMQPLCVFQV